MASPPALLSRAILIVAAVCLAATPAHPATPDEKGTTMTAAPVVEKVADNLVFPEGPVWHPDGFLLFSDVHGATIERLRPEAA